MTDAIFSGLILGLALVFSVGPVIFTLLKLRINYGVSSALFFVGGVWISDILWILTANLSGEWFGALIDYKKPIGVLGGLFLVGLGLFYLFIKKFHSKEEMDSGIRISRQTHARLFLTGFLINTLNPAVIALWFAASTKALSHTFEKRTVLFSICLFLNMSADLTKIHLAGKIRKQLNDRNIRLINKISGVLFILFGLALLAGALYPNPAGR